MCVPYIKMNASSWRKAVDLIAQGTQANQQVQAAATVDSSQLESFSLSSLYIDNVSDYDSEHHRISKSVCHRLDLSPISLLGAQQHTTVEAAAALKMQDKIEGNFKAHMQSDNGQYRNEIYKRAESMIPQLDGTYNVSDSNDTDLHDYLDLASTNIIQYRTRGQKQRHKANEMAYANRCSAHVEM